MKKLRFIQSATVLILFSASITAQQQPTEVIYIRSSRFATPLVEKWASEYEKENPLIQVKFAGEQSSGGNVDLDFISSNNEDKTVNANQTIFYTGRYALLPVTNADNPLLNELSGKRVNDKRLKDLFFEKDILEEEFESSKKKNFDVTVYSGNNANSFANAFASHFGYSKADIKGRKISGDDVFLINAVQKDNRGVTFNNLSYIFDIETRRLKKGLALIPLDVKKEQREIFNEADVDKTIVLLEKETIPLIPVENIGFVYQNENRQAQKFLKWVLSEGQQYNHTFGFLQTKEEILAAQLKEIDYLQLTANY